MIRLIENVIKDKLSSNLNLTKGHIDFVKYSTPLSGSGFSGKVLFFVFVDNEKEPRFVVKTIRRYEEGFVIRNGFNNLKKLNLLVDNTEYSKMFPEALYLYDDKKEFIFSIESVCGGKKATGNNADVDKIVSQYTAFQKNISKKEILATYNTYGDDLVKKLSLEKEDEDVLIGYVREMSLDKNRELIKVGQHGDFTLDNIFISKNGVRVIDCDIFGEISLAGYDIYRFFRHEKKSILLSRLNNYFNALGINIKADMEILFLYYLNELLFKKDYILKGKTGEGIINEFKKMYA